MTRARTLGYLLIALSSQSCASGERTRSSLDDTPSLAGSSTEQSDEVPGFSLEFEDSRMFIGTLLEVDESRPGFVRHVGTDGVFARSANGSAIGVPNASSAASLAPAFAGTGAEHDKAVIAYFVDAGLPGDQVVSASISAAIMGSGSVADLNAGIPPTRTLVGYTTILNRAIEGVPVQGSLASAQINARGEVVSEQVYWPALPRDVVEAAKALQAELADPAGRSALMARLPADVRSSAIQVVIAHSTYLRPDFVVAAALIVQTQVATMFYSREGEPINL